MPRPSRDRSRPIPGRTWYDGAWRTPEQVEHIRAYQARYARERRERDPEYAERERARCRKRHKDTYVRKSQRAAPGEGRGRSQEAQERRNRARREKTRLEASQRPTRPEKPVLRQAPAAVREAWRRGKPNSIIRIKYPRAQDLQAAAQRGDFD